MLTDEALRTMLYQAISTQPARFARVHYTAMPADTHRADGAHHAWLHCLALAVGGHHPMGHASPQDIAAWRALCDALGKVIDQAAATFDEPDYDATLRAVHAVAHAHGLAPHQPPCRPASMQERILAALTAVAQRAGCQVAVQPQFANTGHVYVTAATTFTTLVEVAYHFDSESCGLHVRGPAIEALQLHDSPPEFRHEHTAHGWQVSYHALRYADGQRITAMLDLFTRALTAGTAQT